MRKIVERIFIFLSLLLIPALISAQKVDMSLFGDIKPRNIGPAGMSGRVTAFASDPRNENVFFIGTASGGLWKTLNAGTTFSPVFDNEEVASIGALAVDPVHPDIIWAGTGEGNPRNSVTSGYGIYRSSDGGKTWKCMGLELTRYIHRILIDPVNPDIVYAGAIGNPWAPHTERGLFRTRDGGKNWERILYTSETTGVADMVMDPSNPEKIFVAMWDHSRSPWFFSSSGEGSALWVTHDGGDTFTKVTNGLPEVVGRIGVAIAPSKPEYVYAFVESDTSAIYRSADGGITWVRGAEKNIGNRPFYYAEIYVDPCNENRVYSLSSKIYVSEDGGLTFNRLNETIHSDHHAWWIDPDNSDRILDGNDGGMAISYDRGKTWRHIENLPVGQFYHINVDDETPYNIYGGMQDNGSWRGPSYTWHNGPVINEMYDFLFGGDGFDAMPVPGDNRYCYVQAQVGNIRLTDIVTGWNRNIKPLPEGDEKLRFNWNAALAQDKFDSNTIYFGSQYVHKSTDRGNSWQKISPDLTGNDPEKQKQDQSGGITPDKTGAENHCTILTIAPSSLDRGIIWTGSDDGRIHVTKDGGLSWENVTANIKGLPRGCWIPQITASVYDPATAFVVANDYRQGDNSAYLFRTNNFGRTWKRIIDDTDVWGYVLSFVQDPAEKRLMFAGTEFGLYVSFDEGEIWNRWKNNYPTVSTYDMVIHPREYDLVIGTFGRGIWVIDDIRPLRALAVEGSQFLTKKNVVFEIPESIIAERKNLPGYYFYGDAMYRGENRKAGSMISFYLLSDTTKVNIAISDESDNLIKTMEVNPVRGFNRITWQFDLNQLEAAVLPLPGFKEEPASMRSGRFTGRAVPGRYKIRISSGEFSDESVLVIKADPRMPVLDYSITRQNQQRAEAISARVKLLNRDLLKFAEIKNQSAKLDELIPTLPDFADQVVELQNNVNKHINKLEQILNEKPAGLIEKINMYLELALLTGVAGQEDLEKINEAVAALGQAEKLTAEFITRTWPEHLEKLEKYMQDKKENE